MCAVLCSISTGGGQSRTFRGRTLTYTAACSRTDNGVCNSLLVTVKERVITPLRLARAAEAFGLRWKLPAFWLSSETKRVTTSVPAHARRWLLALCARHGRSRRFIDPGVDGQLILVEIVSLSAWPDTDPTPALALASFVRAPHTGLQQLDVLLIAFRKSNQSLRSLSSTAAHPYGSFRAGTPFPASAVPAIAANLSECWQPYSWTTSSTWFHRRVLSHLAARLLACRQRAGTIHDMSSRATSHPSGWLHEQNSKVVRASGCTHRGERYAATRRRALPSCRRRHQLWILYTDERGSVSWRCNTSTRLAKIQAFSFPLGVL